MDAHSTSSDPPNATASSSRWREGSHGYPRTAGTFCRLLHEDPQLSMRVHEAHAQELCRQASRIGQLCSLSSRQRLQSALRRFAVAAQGADRSSPIRFQLPLLQWELAEFIGITPEHLSRLLRHLEDDGLIRRDNGWIVFEDVGVVRAWSLDQPHEARTPRGLDQQKIVA